MSIHNFPKISIVTPSFNQKELLESTITSILSQDYLNLEYIIIDGGSTDGSLEIIKKYSGRIAYWISEPDKGRGDAVNKGFKHATGEIMAWLGCGDRYCPWALQTVSRIFSDSVEVEWLTTGSYILWDIKGLPILCGFRHGYSRQAFRDGCYLPTITTLQQESTFWRRSLWEKAGGYVDAELARVPDFELWARFFKYAEVYTTSVPLGGFCKHSGQNLSLREYLSIGKKIWRKYYYNNNTPPFLFIRILRSHLKKQHMWIVEYNFETGSWQTRRIYAKVFPKMV